MIDEQSIRDEIAEEIAAALRAKINRPPNEGMVTHLTDAIMPLVRRIQAEARDELLACLDTMTQQYRQGGAP